MERNRGNGCKPGAWTHGSAFTPMTSSSILQRVAAAADRQSVTNPGLLSASAKCAPRESRNESIGSSLLLCIRPSGEDGSPGHYEFRACLF
jgi:hypothetical protein